MSCGVHPDRDAVATCGGCSGEFCADCVVPFEKILLCERCKRRLLDGEEAKAVTRGSGVVPPDRRTRPDGTSPRRSPRLPWLVASFALVFAAGFGFLLVALLAGPWSTFLRDRRHARAHADLARIGAALERFRLERDRYPETLDELVPAFLLEVPDDPYADGGPPRYVSAEGERRLWSRGPDRSDDGGHPPADLVYAIDPPRS